MQPIELSELMDDIRSKLKDISHRGRQGVFIIDYLTHPQDLPPDVYSPMYSASSPPVPTDADASRRVRLLEPDVPLGQANKNICHFFRDGKRRHVADDSAEVAQRVVTQLAGMIEGRRSRDASPHLTVFQDGTRSQPFRGSPPPPALRGSPSVEKSSSTESIGMSTDIDHRLGFGSNRWRSHMETAHSQHSGLAGATLNDRPSSESMYEDRMPCHDVVRSAASPIQGRTCSDQVPLQAGNPYGVSTAVADIVQRAPYRSPPRMKSLCDSVVDRHPSDSDDQHDITSAMHHITEDEKRLVQALSEHKKSIAAKRKAAKEAQREAQEDGEASRPEIASRPMKKRPARATSSPPPQLATQSVDEVGYRIDEEPLAMHTGVRAVPEHGRPALKRPAAAVDTSQLPPIPRHGLAVVCGLRLIHDNTSYFRVVRKTKEITKRGRPGETNVSFSSCPTREAAWAAACSKCEQAWLQMMSGSV